jgi:hypothetical protein
LELCEAECGAGAPWLARDYDAVKAAEEVRRLNIQKGRFWRG